MESTTPHLRLRIWMDANGHSLTWLAKQCYVMPSSVHRWVHGKTKPQRIMAVQIERLTGGEIGADEW